MENKKYGLLLLKITSEKKKPPRVLILGYFQFSSEGSHSLQLSVKPSRHSNDSQPVKDSFADMFLTDGAIHTTINSISHRLCWSNKQVVQDYQLPSKNNPQPIAKSVKFCGDLK